MEFRYRYVGFGTSFVSTSGDRPDAGAHQNDLFENELAVDVGNVCWGLHGETRTIIDHHFYRQCDQFPSASAAVLHKAGPIWDRFHATSVMWLVTHRDPDFDAYCAMYLARAILTGEIPWDGWEALGLSPDGWPGTPPEGTSAFDWFRPNPRIVSHVPDRRWPILLAAYATAVDNCRRLACARSRALHSVLYTASARGRNLLPDGARILFDEASRAIETKGLNPLYDSLFHDSGEFAPELALLDRESEAYGRDIARARRALVSVPTSPQPFDTWFGPIAGTRSTPGSPASGEPLLDDHLEIRPGHLLGRHHRTQVDGIYLRDPECMLFKEWARHDRDHSSAGEGFLFTAIAYTNACPGAQRNSTRYIFSLDPERADGRHLYPLWAVLERSEVQALHRPESGSLKERLASMRPRRGFEDRAGSLEGLFNDPWFDGNNYRCTIVDTPNRGTEIGPPGTRGDLADDPVVGLVSELLEYSIFTSEVVIRDLAATSVASGEYEHTIRLASGGAVPPAASGRFRFAMVGLAEGTRLLHGEMAEQTGRMLWQLLDSDAGNGVPTDFAQRHLIVRAKWVGVWSRRGAVVAYMPDAQHIAESFLERFRTVAEITRGLEALVSPSAEVAASPKLSISKVEDFIAQVAKLKQLLALPENRLPARFFESLHLDEVLATVHGIIVAAADRQNDNRAQQQREDTRQLTAAVAQNIDIVAGVQRAVEFLEIFFAAVYSAHLWHMFAHENAPLLHGAQSVAAPWLSAESVENWLVPAGVAFCALMGGLLAVGVVSWQRRSHHKAQTNRAHVYAAHGDTSDGR